MKKDLVSIIIVNWNGKKWLKKCLDSLHSQTYNNFEIIFVDNNSQDDSVEFVEKNYPLVKIVKSDNLGFGHACNLGTQNAKGNFLMFFNEDTYVDENFVSKFINKYNLIKDKNKIGTIGCVLEDYNKKILNKKLGFGFTIDWMTAPTINFDKEKIFYNTGCPLFIAKNVFNEAGGFCKNIFLFSEDLDLCWRLNLMGYKHFFLEDVYIYHYGGGVIGGYFSPKKLSYYLKGELNCIFNNYSSLFLPFAFFYFLFFYFWLSIGYLLIGKFEYSKTINYTIISELRYNLKNILAFRQIVQAKRLVSDWQLTNKINFIPSRLKNFLLFKHY